MWAAGGGAADSVDWQSSPANNELDGANSAARVSATLSEAAAAASNVELASCVRRREPLLRATGASSDQREQEAAGRNSSSPAELRRRRDEAADEEAVVADMDGADEDDVSDCDAEQDEQLGELLALDRLDWTRHTLPALQLQQHPRRRSERQLSRRPHSERLGDSLIESLPLLAPLPTL